MKIYIANHCKQYYEDGSHHEKNEIPLAEALEIITDDWICADQCCWQTIIDMRNCLKKLLADKENKCI